MCHPNLISLHDLIHEGYFLHQIEEYCEEGDLNYHILRQRKLNRYFSEETVSQWCLQLLLAIEYLHHQKIIHRFVSAYEGIYALQTSF